MNGSLQDISPFAEAAAGIFLIPERQTMAEELGNMTKKRFAKKWSPAIAENGFTQVPNLLLQYTGYLGLTFPELVLLIELIVYFNYTGKHPWPSASTLATALGTSVNTVRRNLRALEHKSFLTREYRTGLSNVYDLSLTIAKLNEIAATLNQKRTDEVSKNEHPVYPKLDTKEEEIIKNNMKNTSTYVEGVGLRPPRGLKRTSNG
jgi:DNA-binding transcriptional regulator YhcF (GntR family)